MWIFKNAKKLSIDKQNIGVIGYSAGGNLVLSLALGLRDTQKQLPKYLLPIYPMLDPGNNSDSAYKIQDPIFLWNRDINILAWALYLQGQKADVYAAPIMLEDFTLLPPTFSQVGDCDMFYDENVAFFSKLKQVNPEVVFRKYKGVYHGSEKLCPDAAISQKMIHDLDGFIHKWMNTP